MTTYDEFLAGKRLVAPTLGRPIEPTAVHTRLFDFQRDVTLWALRKGRAAIFLDTGLGKTGCQLEWARLTGERTLIIAPLSIVKQTIKEGEALGISVHYTRSGDDLTDGINITNYEMVEAFDAGKFGAVVLDESSILKGVSSRTKAKLIKMFAGTPYRLCCTATPAPNDHTEIGNHAEFLGIMTDAEMKAAFFVHDETGWRLKGHAVESFWRWMASWGMSIRKPSDLGYSDEGYDLPPLTIEPVFVPTDYVPDGMLFSMGLHGIQDRTKVRRGTMADRCMVAAEMVNADPDQWIAWCGMNDEGYLLRKLLSGNVLQEGKQSPDEKQVAIEGFQDGTFRTLITKPKISGFGLNLQNAHKMVFVGLSDSWEAFYQCVRRCYRFGQRHPVTVKIVLSEAEEEIYENVMRKEAEAARMREGMIAAVRRYEEEELGFVAAQQAYAPTKDIIIPEWLVTA